MHAKAFVIQATAQLDEVIAEGLRRLLARAVNSRSLDAAALAPRAYAALQKYLLRDTPNAPPSELNQFLDDLHADDLCLIVACERGDDAAWRELIEKYQTMVRGVARSVSGSEDRAEELAQSIWAELHGLRARADGQPSGKLSYYSGRGSLGGWLQAVVRQLAIDAHRRESKLVQTETDADFDLLAHDVRDNGTAQSHGASHALPDPERAFAERESAEHAEEALARAISELNAEDRLLIKLYYFDELSLREAGAILGVHEATASRRLTRLHKGVRARVLTILIKDYGWSRQDATRWLIEASAHFEMNVEQLLAKE